MLTSVKLEQGLGRTDTRIDYELGWTGVKVRYVSLWKGIGRLCWELAKVKDNLGSRQGE